MWARIVEALGDTFATVVAFITAGVVIGIGQLLNSKETLSWRLVFGRAASHGGLAMSAGMVVIWVPDLSILGQIGLAAALASLGVSGIERIFSRVSGIGKVNNEP